MTTHEDKAKQLFLKGHACSQAVLGAAKMVRETGIHPGTLKDMVCSPGGTTIEGIEQLEQKGLRGAVFAAMDACMEKSRQMGKKK